MRIGNYELQRIKNKIIDDLYGKKEEELEKKEQQITIENREIWLKQYKPLLEQLPDSMVTRNKKYQLKVDYTDPTVSEAILEKDREVTRNSYSGDYNRRSNYVIETTWEHTYQKAVINPTDNDDGYSNPEPQPIHTSLKGKLDTLCENILAWRRERNEMSDYLEETTAHNTGSQQLRKIWPEPFHKYLPAESPSTSTKKTKPIPPPAPTGLKDRLTTNLLEDGI